MHTYILHTYIQTHIERNTYTCACIHTDDNTHTHTQLALKLEVAMERQSECVTQVDVRQVAPTKPTVDYYYQLCRG